MEHQVDESTTSDFNDLMKILQMSDQCDDHRYVIK